MPRIREYDSQVLPQGSIGGGSGRRADAQDFGADFTVIGDSLQKVGAMIQEKQEQDEASQVYADMSKARADWTVKFQDMANQAKPGDMNFAQQVGQTITEELQGWNDRYKTRKGQDLFRKLSADMASDFVIKGASTQTQLAGQWAIQKASETSDANAKTISVDPSQYDRIVGEEAQIIYSGVGDYRHLNAAQREQLVTKNKDRYAYTAELAKAEKNPEAYLRSRVPQALEHSKWTATGGGIFGTAVETILKFEGGYVANDAGKGETNFGINKTANPDVDVKNLTKEQAIGIYKERYWKPIGGDNLPPATAMVAFDTAVNMGVGTAKRLLAETGGDPAAMIARRREIYATLADVPGKRGYLPAWNKRMDELQRTVSEGVKAADPVSTVDFSQIKGDSSWNDLDVEKRRQIANYAVTKNNQDMAVLRAQLDGQVKDQVTQALTTGQVGTPIARETFVKAYGPVEGERKYTEEYQPALQLGQAITTVRAMPVARQEAMVEAARPTPDMPGFAAAQKRYELMRQAVDESRRERQKDPIQFGMQQRIPGLQPLDTSSPDAMASGVASRQASATAMAKDFGTPLKLLTNAEAASLGKAIHDMPTSQKLSYLESLRVKVSDPGAFRAVIQQVAPDSPVTAAAAGLLTTSETITKQKWFSPNVTVDPKAVAGIILEGEALLNKAPTDKKQDGASRGFPMPKEDLLRMEFNRQMGTAFAGMPGAADVTYQAVRAYYAGKSARTGNLASKEAPDVGLMREAVENVTGGISDYNGKGKVLMPWGMPEQKFNDSVSKAFATAMKEHGLSGSRLDNVKFYGLQGVGGGKYFLKQGTDFLKDGSGNPVVLDLNK